MTRAEFLTYCKKAEFLVQCTKNFLNFVLNKFPFLILGCSLVLFFKFLEFKVGHGGGDSGKMDVYSIIEA